MPEMQKYYQMTILVNEIQAVPGAASKLFDSTETVWPGNGAMCCAPRVDAM